MEFKKYLNWCHTQAIEKGFYECSTCKGEKKVKKYSNGSYLVVDCEDCNGTGKNENMNLGQLLILIICEICEALEADRKDEYCNLSQDELDRILVYDLLNKEKVKLENYENSIKGSFQEEIADTFIRLFDICKYLDLENIETFIHLKMSYNKYRPKKHNKKY